MTFSFMDCIGTYYVLLHNQSDTETVSTVNKEVLQENLEQKSLVSERLLYDR